MSSAPLSKEKPIKSPAMPPKDTVIKKTEISYERLPRFGFGKAKYIGEYKHGSVTLKSRKSMDKKNQLDVTFCIVYFSSNRCSTCFGQPCAHHQELTTA